MKQKQDKTAKEREKAKSEERQKNWRKNKWSHHTPEQSAKRLGVFGIFLLSDRRFWRLFFTHLQLIKENKSIPYGIVIWTMNQECCDGFIVDLGWLIDK